MRDFLIENHIWKDQEGKDKFLAKEKKITNEFWINFLGFLGLYAKYKDEIRLIQYFKQSTVRLEKVTDSDNDFMVILKIIDDKKVIPDMVMTKITRMLAKLKMGTLGGLDENLFRTEILKRIKVTTIYPYPQISALIKNFNKGNITLAEMLPDLYSLAIQHKRGHEFRVMYKRLSGVSDGASDTDTQTSIDTTVSTIPVSPVKSALTGVPKSSIQVKTQVIPDPPKDLPKTISWADILTYIGSNYSNDSSKKQALLIYCHANSSNDAELKTLLSAMNLGYSRAQYLFNLNDVSAFFFNDIDGGVKKEFPTINTLYKPIMGDIKNVPEHIKKWLVQLTPYNLSLGNLFTFLYLNTSDNLHNTSGFIDRIYNYVSDISLSLIRFGVPQNYIDKSVENAKSFADYAFKNHNNITVKSLITSYGFDASEYLDEIYGDKKFDIFSYIDDDTMDSLDNKKNFHAFLERETTSVKELALRFIKLSRTDLYPYKWASENLSFEDKVASGMTFAMLDKDFVKGFSNWNAFNKTHLQENNFTFKQFMTKYGLSYETFLENVRSDNNYIFKYISFALWMYDRYKSDVLYLIDDLVLHTKPGMTWFPIYSSNSPFEKFMAIYCLNYFIEKKDLQMFSMLVSHMISQLRFGDTSRWALNDSVDEIIKGMFASLTPKSETYRELLAFFTHIFGDLLERDPVSKWDIDLNFIFNNPEYFIKLPYSGNNQHKLNEFISMFENSSINLANNTDIDKALTNLFDLKIKNEYEYYPIIQGKFNKPTLEHYKEIILKMMETKLAINARLRDILLDLNYMVKIGILSKQEMGEFYLSNIPDRKNGIFNTLDSLYTGSDMDVFFDSTLINELNDKDTLIEYMLTSPRNRSKLRPIGSSKEITEIVSEYLDRNSMLIGKLYEDHGVDAIVEYFSDDKIQNIWKNISSGKRLLNKSNSLELIMLDILSNRNKIDDIDKLLNAFPDKIKNSLINTLKEQLLVYPLLNDIYVADNPLKPSMNLTPQRIKTLLKYNNFEFRGGMLRKKPKEQWAEYFKRVSDNLKDEKLIPDINLEKIEETQDQLNEKTVEYSKYYNGMHGSSAVEFLESFNVNMKYPYFEEFKQRFGTDNLVPAFHGSGLTASNFILRFGFTVIPATDSSTVGRMLDMHNVVLVKPKSEGDAIPDSNDYVEYIENGYFPVSSNEVSPKQRLVGDQYSSKDYHIRTISTVGGIYVSNVIEKVAQYLGDEGFSRKEGTIGTIYECEVNLGTFGLHYNVAGTGSDSIRSPEWALCWPQGQINIVRAHKVKFTTKKYVNELKKKYPQAVQENKYFKRFADFLQEQEMVKPKNVITFVFHQCTIPTNKNILPWDEYEKKVIKKSDKMYIDSNQFGVGVVFHTERDLNGVIRVPFTDEFVAEDPDGLYSQFLMLVDECKG